MRQIRLDHELVSNVVQPVTWMEVRAFANVAIKLPQCKRSRHVYHSETQFLLSVTMENSTSEQGHWCSLPRCHSSIAP